MSDAQGPIDRLAAPAKRCPICGRPRDTKYDPFCSRRCAAVDLHRWLTGRYAIPGTERRISEGDQGEEEE